MPMRSLAWVCLSLWASSPDVHAQSSQSLATFYNMSAKSSTTSMVEASESQGLSRYYNKSPKRSNHVDKATMKSSPKSTNKSKNNVFSKGMKSKNKSGSRDGMSKHTTSMKIRRMDVPSGKGKSKGKGKSSSRRSSSRDSKKGKGKEKEKSTKGKGKGVAPTPVTPSPSVAPVIPPTASPTIAEPPSNGGVPVCAPTSGICIEDFAQLNQALSAATVGEIISLCGGAVITASGAFSPIAQSGITLCCLGEGCRITLEDSTITVTGDRFTFYKIHVFGGIAGSPGGQMTITGGGQHILDSVAFEGSASGIAAVYVETIGSLTVKNSEFTNSASTGLYVTDARKVVVDTSIFSSNLYEGMATTWNLSGPRDVENEGQDLEIRSSIFSSNGYDGLLVTNLGTSPRLSVTLSFFTLNNVRGATFCCAQDYGSLVLSGNSGFGNRFAECNEFLFRGLGENGGDVCLPFDTERP